MKVTTISKTQVQEIEAREPGFAETVMNYSVGKTAGEFLVPHDKFLLLKNKFGVNEISTISDPIQEQPTAKKIMRKSNSGKRKCSSCARKKK